jgi:Zn-dependent membrane protease YugP
MPVIIAIVLLLGLIFGPQLWARYTFKRYARPRDDIPGSGAELARHLLTRFEMKDVKVEQADEQSGDHYDPQSRTVRLSANNYTGRSLTAVAVAAHEVGHAIQHARNDAMLNLRSRLVAATTEIQKLGTVMLFALPVLAILTRSPLVGLLTLLAVLATMGAATIVHLVTLPVEWDASFNKAMPILTRGKYISSKDTPAVRRILRAAALTYVAASLASLLNLWRWIAVLRR